MRNCEDLQRRLSKILGQELKGLGHVCSGIEIGGYKDGRLGWVLLVADHLHWWLFLMDNWGSEWAEGPSQLIQLSTDEMEIGQLPTGMGNSPQAWTPQGPVVWLVSWCGMCVYTAQLTGL